jgi:hypothetical protein
MVTLYADPVRGCINSNPLFALLTEEKLQAAKVKMSLHGKGTRKATLSLPLDEATSVNFLEKHVRHFGITALLHKKNITSSCSSQELRLNCWRPKK